MMISMEIQDEISTLLNEVEQERDWRVNEFRQIKTIYLQLKENDQFIQTYASMCIPMLYAHWEGFCVSIFRIVVNFINSKQLAFDKIHNSLFTYSHDKTYNYLKGKQSFPQRCRFSSNFLQSLESNPIVLGRKYDCKSNLKYKILENLLEVFSIEDNRLKVYSVDLNRLVEVRNAIAHGENSIVVNDEMIQKYIDLIVNLYDGLILIFKEYIESEKYLK